MTLRNSKNARLLLELSRKIRYEPGTGDFFWQEAVNIGVPSGARAGCSNQRGYWRIGFKGKSFLAHRLAWVILYGRIPEMLDHIDGNPGNNRIQNLRETTSRKNNQNRVVHRNGYIPCTRYVPNLKKWVAKYWDRNKQKNLHLGCFLTQQEARKAYLKFEEKKNAL